MSADHEWSEVARAFRAFVDRAEIALTRPNGEAALRAVLSSAQPFSALAFLMIQSPQFRSTFMGEVLGAIARGPTSSLLLARDVLRSMPREVLAARTPEIVASMLAGSDDQEYARLSEIIVELRLSDALDVLRTAAARHPDEQVRELGQRLESVEEDAGRWGRLVQEWPIQDAE